MALITCKECSNEVSSTAAACPKCGARVKPKSNVLPWVLGVPVGLFVLMMAIGSANSNPEKTRARQAFELCMKDLDDRLRDPGTTPLVRGACQKMREDFVRKYGVEP